MNRKPRILLIPDVSWWVIGEMGKQIVRRFSSKYDFYLLPESVLERRPDLVRELARHVDVIHCISYETIVLFRDFELDSLPPIASWIHHVTKWEPLQQMAIERSAALTVCTDPWKLEVEKRLSRDIPITVIPHGVDTEFFRPKKVDGRRFGIPPDRFVVGFLANKGSARDQGRKGIDILFEVARRAAKQIPNFHLVIGGPGWDEEAEELRASGVSVSSTGYIRRADVPDLYCALDVYLLTSRVEGGPCTVFEAMACETAVVSTKVGVVPELITDGVDGCSTEIDDVDALVDSIVKLHGLPEHRASIGKNGRRKILERSWAAVLTPLESVYDRLIEQRQQVSESNKPTWMESPEALQKSSSAADALLNVYGGVRTGKMKLPKGLRLLRELLDQHSFRDVVSGAMMIRRYKLDAK
ncbi:MAG TPA: glycosyltransferase family 4 protein [Acidobacteriaceae bacterium]|nr:glycosyltransferase family 4 protein [Acidobacteriaceae bacterium]